MLRAPLEAAGEKNRQGSSILLRADLAVNIRAWFAEKLAAAQDDARLRGEPTPDSLPDDTPLFTVPAGLVRILDRDLVMAGIARKVKDSKTGKVRIDKRDGRGWSVDVHALRHTLGTLLSRAGVAPRTVQAVMRHSTLDLTMNVYTDPRLLDVAGAVDALPDLLLKEAPETERQRATGTGDNRPLAPNIASNLVQAATPGSNADEPTDGEARKPEEGRRAKVTDNKGLRHPLNATDKRCQTGRYRTRTCDFIRVRDAL